jgi:tetratricopeptide (TPR) repeat protein
MDLCRLDCPGPSQPAEKPYAGMSLYPRTAAFGNSENWCMQRAYNRGFRMEVKLKNARKMRCFPSGLALVLLSITTACRTTPPVEVGTVDAGDAKAAKESILEADQLYDQRAELTKARQALALLRHARTADYGSYEATWKLARAAYYVGSHTADEESEEMFREGIVAGKIAVQLQESRPEGHFWLGANYGGSAERSTLASLANVEDIRREMETVIKIDEKFQGGSAYMALGQLYLQAPRVLGGDTAKALEYLNKGIRIAPDNALMRLRLAEAYHEAGRDGEARKQIATLLAMTPSPDYLPEHNDALEGAKKLQEKLK